MIVRFLMLGCLDGGQYPTEKCHLVEVQVDHDLLHLWQQQFDYVANQPHVGAVELSGLSAEARLPGKTIIHQLTDEGAELLDECGALGLLDDLNSKIKPLRLPFGFELPESVLDAEADDLCGLTHHITNGAVFVDFSLNCDEGYHSGRIMLEWIEPEGDHSTGDEAGQQFAAAVSSLEEQLAA